MRVFSRYFPLACIFVCIAATSWALFGLLGTLIAQAWFVAIAIVVLDTRQPHALGEQAREEVFQSLLPSRARFLRNSSFGNNMKSMFARMEDPAGRSLSVEATTQFKCGALSEDLRPTGTCNRAGSNVETAALEMIHSP